MLAANSKMVGRGGGTADSKMADSKMSGRGGSADSKMVGRGGGTSDSKMVGGGGGGEPVRMRAKFAGKCRECGGTIPQDAEMLWWPNKGGVAHMSCLPPAQQRHVKPLDSRRGPKPFDSRPGQPGRAVGFAAKYAGRCKACGGPFAVGDPIARLPHGVTGFQHASCSF
jgi:hypothetical protein